MASSPNPEITIIGSDPSLAYLIGRFAEQSGFRTTSLQNVPKPDEIRSRKPRLVLFLSMNVLETAQSLVTALANGEIPVAVCASMRDEARARELGADYCLFHPLTIERFTASITGGRPDLPGDGKDF